MFLYLVERGDTARHGEILTAVIAELAPLRAANLFMDQVDTSGVRKFFVQQALSVTRVGVAVPGVKAGIILVDVRED